MRALATEPGLKWRLRHAGQINLFASAKSEPAFLIYAKLFPLLASRELP